MDASLLNVTEWRDPLLTRGWNQSGGQVTLPGELPAANANLPREFLHVLSWESLTPQSCEWQVSLQTLAALANSDFPPQDTAIKYPAGAVSGASLWAYQAAVTCKVELGSGPDARTIYTDLIAGRYSLGVQSRVRVSVARWRSAGAPIQIQSAVAPAKHTDSDPPTFSALRLFNSNESAQIMTPCGAQWFEVTGVAQGGGLLSLASEGVQMVVVGAHGLYGFDSTASPPIMFPGPPPWPVDLGGFLSVRCGTVPAIVCVRFWVR